MFALHLINGLSKAGNIVVAGHQAIKAYQKDNLTFWEKINVATQFLFACFQSGDLVADYVLFPKKGFTIHLLTHTATGALDIAKTVTGKLIDGSAWTKEHGINLTGTFVMRVGDMGDFLCRLSPHARVQHALCETIEAVGSLVKTTNYFYHNLKPSSIAEGEIKEDASRERLLDDVELDEDWLDCHEEYAEDGIDLDLGAVGGLDIFICPISKRKISTILVPALPEQALQEDESLSQIWYEAQAIRRWIRRSPDKKPPGWPLQHLPLPLKETQVIPYARFQKIIDLKRPLS